MFRGAVRADLARILDIYARAREFMAKNGNPTQWGDGYPSPELLEEDIDTNRLFVYMVNGRMQAVFAFILGEDPTYKELLQKHRMETAARLLRRSDLTIQQISAQVGYENTSYFYRLFHERYGLSPREYRLVRTGTAPRRPTA